MTHEWSQVTTNNTLGFLVAEELWSWTPIAWETGTSSFILVAFSTPPAGFCSNVTYVNSNAISPRLLKIFGPDQFILIATSGAPFSPETTELFAPQTLHGCLHLPYVCRSVVINGVPKSSGNILWGHHRAGNIIVRRADWTQATFHAKRERIGGLRYGHIDLLRDTCGRYLFNGRPYSERFQGNQYAEHRRPGQGN